MRLKENAWLIAKLVLVFSVPLIGASMISDLGAENTTPPLWIAPLVFVLCFIGGLVCRFASRTPPWTERELWFANPFRYVFRFRDPETPFYPPWIHFGAFSTFISPGLGALAYSIFFRPEMNGHGATIFAMGLGLWFGIRSPDILKSRKLVKRSPTTAE